MKHWTLWIAAAIAGSAACGGSPTSPTGGGRQTAAVTSVAITGTLSLSEGSTSQLTATATRSDGTTENVTSRATWQSSNTMVATVSGTGLVTAVNDGTSDITAVFESQTARRTAQIEPAQYDLSLNVQSIAALSTCDDVTQGLTMGEFAVRVVSVLAGGSQTELVETSGYPGNSNDPSGYELGEDESRSLNVSRTFTIAGSSGQFLRMQFSATEWDYQIVVIPPSIRYLHDNRLSNVTATRTHSFTNGTFSSLGPNALTAGNSSCGLRLNYTLSATRR
jgi:hypothetical protein